MMPSKWEQEFLFRTDELIIINQMRKRCNNMIQMALRVISLSQLAIENDFIQFSLTTTDTF